MEGKYYHTAESVREYIHLAKDVNGRRLIEKLKQFLVPNTEVLELGSGPGTDWKILAEYYEATGSDNSIEFLKHLEAKNPNGNFLELDASTLATDQKFAGIYSNKVLHHLNDQALKESIHRQYEILEADGIICHSFWKGQGTEIFKGLFVNYHEEVDLKEAFEQKFEILLMEAYKEFEVGDSLLLIARKR